MVSLRVSVVHRNRSGRDRRWCNWRCVQIGPRLLTTSPVKPYKPGRTVHPLSRWPCSHQVQSRGKRVVRQSVPLKVHFTGSAVTSVLVPGIFWTSAVGYIQRCRAGKEKSCGLRLMSSPSALILLPSPANVRLPVPLPSPKPGSITGPLPLFACVVGRVPEVPRVPIKSRSVRHLRGVDRHVERVVISTDVVAFLRG